MTIKFRPHRELLTEAMQEMKEFETLDELKSIFNTQVEIKYYAYDDRIDWNTYLITDHVGVRGFAHIPVKMELDMIEAEMADSDHKKVILIRANGVPSLHLYKTKLDIADLHDLIGYETFDAVNLRNGRVMLVDDNGHINKHPEPVNKKATQLYHSVCVPGTIHQIVGDVIVCWDKDFN